MKTLSAIIIITLFSAAAFAQVGELDNTFGTGGKLQNDFPDATYSGSINAMAIAPDGKILIAGSADVSGAFSRKWFISRYNIDGSIDNSFGVGGSILGPGETTAVVLSLSVQPDLKVLALEDDEEHFRVARYNVDGSYDNNFNVYSYYYDVFTENTIGLQADGKIVVGGSAGDHAIGGATGNFCLARYNPNGILDTAFNAGGIVTTLIDSGSTIYSLAIDSDKKIVAAGTSFEGGHYRCAMARYNPNGTLDSSFNINGILTTTFGADVGIRTVAIQSDGKIVVSVYGPNSVDYYDFLLARYNNDGTLDSTFGNAGIVMNAVGVGVTSFTIQTDDKIVTAGYSLDNPTSDFALTRRNPNGTLDSTFGDAGITYTDFGNNWDLALAVHMQPDGKIVAAGDHFYGIELARYFSGLDVGILNFSSSQSSPLIYPNPIQQTETLEYILTNNESLTIALYDVNGTMVRNFISNEQRAAGAHEETLHMGELAPGTYFLTLSNGAQRMNVKLVK